MKIFLPGPTMVRADVLAQTARPMIGHHSPEFANIVTELNLRFQWLLCTKFSVYLLTCSASGAMEAALLNAVHEKVLILSNGGFGERWIQAARALGFKPDVLSYNWGEPIRFEEVREKLATVNYDAVIMVHGESSTGMLNPIGRLHRVLNASPETLCILDSVATLGGVPIRMDDLGIDILIGSSQKCLALPPGVVPVGVSSKALKKSSTSPRKGYAHDFNYWEERWGRGETVGTPAISLFFAMQYQLGKIASESLEKRWNRHQTMMEMTLEWAKYSGLKPLYPDSECMPPISCLTFTDGRSTLTIVDALQAKGYEIDAGYGKLRDKVLRIGHMGDWTADELKGLLRALTEVIG